MTKREEIEQLKKRVEELEKSVAPAHQQLRDALIGPGYDNYGLQRFREQVTPRPLEFWYSGDNIT